MLFLDWVPESPDNNITYLILVFRLVIGEQMIDVLGPEKRGSLIHGYCISVRRLYIRTAPLWPLLCGMQYAQDIHFSPLPIDLINQNKNGGE